MNDNIEKSKLISQLSTLVGAQFFLKEARNNIKRLNLDDHYVRNALVQVEYQIDIIKKTLKEIK